MKFERKFTRKGRGPYDGITWENRVSEIRNPQTEACFPYGQGYVPLHGVRSATISLAQNISGEGGVLRRNRRGLWTKFVPESQTLLAADSPNRDSEHDARQVFHRLAYTWCLWGRNAGYFDSDDDEKAFYDELVYMLAHQLAAPNSPQWFNTGLNAVYGIEGPPQGHYYVDPTIERGSQVAVRPMPGLSPTPVFFLDIQDDLVIRGRYHGHLITRVAPGFSNYGSGTGSNFSKIRAAHENLSGGGVSSGLLSFLKIADRSAAAVKSGGTTRRAAKMVILDADHPDIEPYVAWKAEEEYKVACLAAGSAVLKRYAEGMKSAIENSGLSLDSAFSFSENAALRKAVKEALAAGIPSAWIHQVLSMYRQTGQLVSLAQYDTGWESEAYNTVSGNRRTTRCALTISS